MKIKSFECPKSIRNDEKKYFERQILGRQVVCPIGPANQRIILQIIGFQVGSASLLPKFWQIQTQKLLHQLTPSDFQIFLRFQSRFSVLQCKAEALESMFEIQDNSISQSRRLRLFAVRGHSITTWTRRGGRWSVESPCLVS